MSNQAAPAPFGFPVVWHKIGRIVARLLATRAHTDVIISVKGGKLEMVRVNQAFRPEDLPETPG